MKTLKSLILERSLKYPDIVEGNNYLSTEFSAGISLTADNADPRDQNKAGHTLHLTFISKNNLDIIEDNKDVISKYFKKYFDDIYDRPIWSSTKSPNRSTLFSSGTLGGMAWLYPHFQQFADDVSKLLTKELYK